MPFPVELCKYFCESIYVKAQVPLKSKWQPLHALNASKNVFRAPGILNHPLDIILEWKPEKCEEETKENKIKQNKTNYTSRCITITITQTAAPA